MLYKQKDYIEREEEKEEEEKEEEDGGAFKTFY